MPLAVRRELPAPPFGKLWRPRATSAAPAPAPPYNPLTAIPWAHAFYAEGPDMAALAYADAASVTSWPNEITAAAQENLSSAGNPPTYRATSNLNSKPAVRFDGVNDFMTSQWVGTISLPFTVAFIAKLNVQTDGTTYVMLGGQNTSVGRHDIMTNTTPNPDQWMGFAGANVSGGDADTASHLFVFHAAASSGSSLELDGTAIALGVTSTHTSTGLVLGCFGNGSSFPANEDVAFAAVIGRVLTAQEKTDLRTWSSGKYATA